MQAQPQRSPFAIRRRGVRTAALLLVLTLSAVQASELAAHPEAPSGTDTAAATPHDRFLRAQALARAGEPAAALAIYSQLAAQYPENVDYLFGEAQTRFRLGDPVRALQLTGRARQLAPGYEDVWRLEYQILTRSTAANAGQLRDFRAAARSRFPQAGWIRDGVQAQATAWHWESGMTREYLDNGAEDWQHIYLYVDHETPADSALSLTLSEYRRFSKTDREVAVGGSVTIATSWLLNGTVRHSPNAEFLAESAVDAGVGRLLGGGWIAGVGVAHRRYAGDSVNTWRAQLERYFGRFRAAYRLDRTRLETAASSSLMHSAVLNYFADSGSRYSLTVAAGDEVEVIAPGRLLNMNISAIALSGRHPVGSGLSIVWRIGTHRQGEIYRRSHVGLSIAGEF